MRSIILIAVVILVLLQPVVIAAVIYGRKQKKRGLEEDEYMQALAKFREAMNKRNRETICLK